MVMSDSVAEIIDAVGRALASALQIRLEMDDGRVVETGIDAIHMDMPLVKEMRRDPPCGEFRASLLPEGMYDVEDWVMGGTVYTIETDGGGWRPVTVSWATGVDEDGGAIDEYAGEVVAAEVVSDE